MDVIVVGAGRVGFAVAEKLCAEQHNVVVIDQSESRLQRVSEFLDALTIEGAGSSGPVLERARIEKADLFIAVTDSDEANLIACQLARHYGVPKRIARVGNPGLLPSDGGMKPEDLGADLFINPSEVCAREIARLLDAEALSESQEFVDGRVVMVGLTAEESNPMLRQTLKSLHDVEIMQRVRLVAIGREGLTIIPRGDTRVEQDDELFFMCPREELDHLYEYLRIDLRPFERITIVGGGEVGTLTAGLLEGKDATVNLLEWDERRAGKIAEELRRTSVYHGDAGSLKELQNVGIEATDAFVAACGDDEVNILSCLMAKQFGARKTLAVIRKPEYVPLLNSIKRVDAAVSPLVVTANTILRFIRRGKVFSVVMPRVIDAEVIEVEVPERSRVKDRKIQDIRFPTGAIIGCIVRGSRVLPAPGYEQLLAGDRVVVLARPDSMHEVEDLFAGKARGLFS